MISNEIEAVAIAQQVDRNLAEDLPLFEMAANGLVINTDQQEIHRLAATIISDLQLRGEASRYLSDDTLEKKIWIDRTLERVTQMAASQNGQEQKDAYKTNGKSDVAV